MSRPRKPWWYAAKARWAATVDGRRRLAPAGIRRSDEHAAWAWHARLLDSGRAVPRDTVGAICEAYLQWDGGRVAIGARDLRSHQNTCSVARRLCSSLVGGVEFGSMRIVRVQPDHFDALLAEWAKAGAAPGYRRSLASLAKAVFRWASRRVEGRPKLIAASPFEDAKLPPAPKAGERYASRDEAAAWLRWLWRRGRRDYATLQRCLIHTGARPSELTRAKWGEITWRGERPAVLTRPDWKCSRKTGKPRRVFLPRRLHRALKRRRGGSGDLVFGTEKGRQWTASHLSVVTARLRRLAIEDGEAIGDDGPDRLTCYRWRHTAASSLLMAGVPVPTVAELLGTSPQQIAGTYGHILSDHLADAADVLARRRS